MAVASTRAIQLRFSGSFSGNSTYNAASNADSPGEHEFVTLAIGANTITPPGRGSVPVAVTIIPPAGNTETITLKGITGDTGVVLHLTDPTSIGLNSPTNTVVLTVTVEIIVVQLIWS